MEVINDINRNAESSRIFLNRTKVKIDLMILVFTSFLGMVCYSVILPSIALYLKEASFEMKNIFLQN